MSKLVLLCVFCMLPLNLWAEGFRVISATTYRVGDGHYLNAEVVHDVHPEAQAILSKGLPIRITFELQIQQSRRYWWDKTILEREYEYVLQHDPITDRYEMTRTDTSFTLSYASADEAIESIRYLSNLLITNNSIIDDPENKQAQLRVHLDVRNFPEPMQYLSQYWGDWVVSSEWYLWEMDQQKSQILSNDQLDLEGATEATEEDEVMAPDGPESFEDVELNESDSEVWP